MFPSDENEDTDITVNQLNVFVEDGMIKYLEIVQCYIDKNTSDTAVLVRALDRFYKQIQAIGKLFSYKDFTLYVLKTTTKNILFIFVLICFVYPEMLWRLYLLLLDAKQNCT